MSLSYPQVTHQIGGNTAGATALISTGTFFLAGGNNVTLSQNANSLTISAGAGGGGGSVNLSAGTTSNNLTNFVLADSNGISFGLNGSTVTAQHNALTSQSNQALSAANGSFTFQTATFADSNGVSFSTGTQGIFATVKTDYLTTQLGQAFSADASSTFQTLTLQDSNGISFSNNAGALRITHALQFTSNTSAITSNALHTSASRVINVVAATNNTGGGTASLSSNVSFSAANGITFYTSAGNAIAASHNALTSQSNQAFSAAGGSSAFQTLAFGDTNSVSFTNTNGSVGVASIKLQMFAVSNTTQSTSGTANHTALSFGGAGIASVGVTGGSIVVSVPAGGGAAGTNTLGMSDLGNTSGTTGVVSDTGVRFLFAGGNNITLSQSLNGVSGTLTISAFNQSAQTMGVYMSSNTTSSNSSGTVDARSMTFRGMGVASVGHSNGEVIISVPAGGGGGFSGGMSTGGSTSGTTGVISNQLVFVGSNGIGLSQSVNGNSATLSIVEAPYYSFFAPQDILLLSTSQMGNATMFLWPISVNRPATATRACHPISMSVSTSSNSSHAGAVSWSFGIYTLNGTTLSLATSGSTAYQWTNTSNNSTSVLSGLRHLFATANMHFTPGHYWLAHWSRTTTTNANWFTASNVIRSVVTNAFSGELLQSSNSSAQLIPGFGMHSNASFSTAMPNSINMSDIKGGIAGANRLAFMHFVNQTF